MAGAERIDNAGVQLGGHCSIVVRVPQKKVNWGVGVAVIVVITAIVVVIVTVIVVVVMVLRWGQSMGMSLV